MSLITQSPKNPAISEKKQLVEQAKRRAQQDFSSQQIEATLKTAYENELTRLRKGEAPVSQPRPALHANPPKPTSAPTTKKESVMDAGKKVQEMTARFMAAQSHTPEPLKPAPPSPDTSLDPNMARRVVECWNASSEAKKDFKTLADFYDFAIASEAKNAKLPPHIKGLCGLPFYERRAQPNS
ncbi:MAG TPA: hypothetical protein PKK23_15775 [Nitrospirales bacterium]|nr:hypothetical protein [Nitrospiraceae bacterium]HNP30505.1 hypothetical protein [Nitrospirales bacterium]